MQTCDFCRRQNQARRRATFLLITGNLQTQTVEDWLICIDHADQIHAAKHTTLIIAGIHIDAWKLTGITPAVETYYHNHPPAETTSQTTPEITPLKQAIQELKRMLKETP